jgi:hypothetical protein
MPDDSNGFPSRGVYGNFLSHLEIIQCAYRDNLDTVLILEDDAIFSNKLNRNTCVMSQCLRDNKWDLFFLGHSVVRGLPWSRSGIVRFSGDFLWAHCYAVHRRIMPSIIDYLRGTIDREKGHPEGAKMYIDGAHNLFRRLNPDVICLLSSPCLSGQKGSPSGLAARRWYDGRRVLQEIVQSLRYARDEGWRHGLINLKPKAKNAFTVVKTATPWPEA